MITPKPRAMYACGQRLVLCAGLMLSACAAPDTAPSHRELSPALAGATLPVGLYAVWHGARDDVFASPAVVGGQAWTLWSDLEPRPGHYDFSVLDRHLSAIDRAGRQATIQVNANRHPAWLFAAVPSLPIALPGVQSAQGSPMYWHPTYVRAQLALIEALAAWIEDHPRRRAIGAVRLSFNGIGTEGLGIPSQYRQASVWRTPAEVANTPALDWTKATGQAYAARITEHYLDHIAPVVPLLVRRSLVQGTNSLGAGARAQATRERIAKLLDSGGAGIFHTSSEMQPRNGGYSAEVFRTMYRECRERQRLCYAEGRTLANDAYAQFPVTAPPSAEQWFYWRILADLHLGISRLAINRVDLLRSDASGFDAARALARDYLGAHLRPAASPGAWVAFRQGDFEQGDYTVLASARGCGRRVTNVGTTQHPFGVWATRLGVRDGCHIDLDPRFARAIVGEELVLEITALAEGADQPVALTVSAMDSREHTAVVEGRDQWQHLRIPLGKSVGDSLALTLASGPERRLFLHRVEVRRVDVDR